MNNLDIQRYDRQLLAVEKRYETLDISERNKTLIRNYVRYRAADGLSKARQITYYERLHILAKYLKKDFDKAGKEDIVSLVSNIRRLGYTANTIHTCLTVLKSFMKHVYPQEDDEYPKVVRWIRISDKTDKTINPLDLWTEEDVKRILECHLPPRDKAFIVALFESGCRISELGNTRIGSVTFDDYGCILSTGKSKTFARPMRLVAAAPYLAKWINMHPAKDDPEAPLWCALEAKAHGQLMTYQALRKILRKCAHQAGIIKKCNPHWFRHSRQTILAGIMTHAQQCAYAGWKQGSSMPQVYIHLSQNGVEEPLLAHYGIHKAEKVTQSVLNPLKCPKCSTMNILTAIICSKCQAHLVLRSTPASEVKIVQMGSSKPRPMESQDIFQDQRLQQMMVEFMKTCLQTAANGKQGPVSEIPGMRPASIPGS